MHLLTRCTHTQCCTWCAGPPDSICHEIAAGDLFKPAVFLVWCSQLLILRMGDIVVIVPIDRAVRVYMHVVESMFVNAAFKWPI